MKMFRWGLLAVALTAAALAPVARASDPKYLPTDTQWVFTLNVKQILNSPLAKSKQDDLDKVKGELARHLESNPAGKYIKDAGFDVFKDFHSITVAGTGAKEPSFILVEGKFDPEKFVAAAENAINDKGDGHVKVTKVGNRKIFEITPPDEKRLFATLVNGKMLALCDSRESLDDAIGRIEGAKKSTQKQEFKALLETTNDTQSVSFVATGPAIAKLIQDAKIQGAEALNPAMQNIDGMSMAVTVAKDIQFQVGVNAKDEENAKKMAGMGNASLLFVRAMVAKKAQEEPNLAPIVDIANTLKITNQGSNVLLRGQVTGEVIEKLMKNLPQ